MLSIDFINIGYGDSILIRELREEACIFSMLIDAGDESVGTDAPATTRISAADYLAQAGLKKLDALLTTHLHKDHTGGLPAVTKRFPAETMYLPCSAQAACARVFRDDGGALDKPGAALCGGIRLFQEAVLNEIDHHATLIACGAEELCLAPTPELRIELLPLPGALAAEQERLLKLLCAPSCTPPEAQRALSRLDEIVNRLSVAARIRYGGRTALLCGDAVACCWNAETAERCDLLKLAHHGHRDSMTPALARAFRPRYVVICVSDDRADDCPSIAIREIFSSAAPAPRLFCTDAIEIDRRPRKGEQALRFLIGQDGRICAPERL